MKRATRILERGSQSQFEYRPADRRQGRPNDSNRRIHRDWCRGERDSAVRSPLARRPGRAVLRRPVRPSGALLRAAPTISLQFPIGSLAAPRPLVLSEKLPFACQT
jgi:hypothetical protein